MHSQKKRLSPEEGKSREIPAGGTSHVCPNCGASLVENRGVGGTVCTSCGLVVGDGEDFDAYPQRAVSGKNEVGEIVGVGPPESPLYHDKGLSTEVSSEDRDGRGNPLSSKEEALARKLRRWQKRCRVSGDGERNLTIALREIDRMGSQVGVPKNVRKVASQVYRKAADEGFVVGRSIEGVSSAALYAACRDCRIPRTIAEIAELANVDEKEARQTYRSLARTLNLNLPPLNASKYIRRFGGKLEISKETRSEAIDVVRKAYEESLVSGRAPSVTAVAGLYVAACLNGEKVLQQEAEDAINVPQQTVSERYRQIAEGLDIDVKFQSWMLAPIESGDASQRDAGESEGSSREETAQKYEQEKLPLPV